MRPALQLRLGQQLALTPQLQQALRLLALPTLELERELQSALDSNLMLETVEPGNEAAGDADDDAALGSDPVELELEAEPDWDPAHADESWNAPRGTSGEAREPIRADELDLRTHLLEQLPLCRLSDADREIALALIDALDDHGYLAEPVATLATELAVGADEVEAVRHLVQRLDPVGAASLDLRDCLLAQLGEFDTATPALAAARGLVDQHLEALAQPRLAQLARQLGVGEDEVALALRLIRSLHPRPAALLPGAATEYLRPDAIVQRRGPRWVVELTHGTLPALRVNEAYAKALVRGGDPALRAQLAEARWLVKSLAMRHTTVLRVARAIVERQVGFLERGPEAMRPLQLKEVAAELGVHESTISRVAAGKYLLTPRGAFEFRHFFSTQLGSDTGDEVSSTAVRALIQRLVAEEDARRPLSDAAIVQALARRGIRVARRTVTKYREALAIPASYERRATV